MATATDLVTSRLGGRAAIPLSDAASVRRALLRTTVVRLVLALALLIVAALAVWRASGLGRRAVAFLPPSSTTMLVLDQSKSVYVSSYRRIGAVLRRIAAADVPVGLVVFSDTAYELMPPGAHGSELSPLVRYFTPRRAGPTADPSTLFPTNPWTNAFSGGTKISAGLALAQSILHRDRIHHGTILLLSDLGTASEDQTQVAETLLRIEHDPSVQLEIVPLFPIASDLAFFQHFVPARAFIQPAQIAANKAPPARLRLVSGSPWPLVIVAGILIVLLAVNELLCARLVLNRPRAVPA